MNKNKQSVGESCAKKTSIGGQALIEGIMMRGPKLSAMAVRNPEGEIVLETWETKSTFKNKFFKLPFIRGIFNFIDSMASGYKCLMRSAEIAGLEDEEPKKNENTEKGSTESGNADAPESPEAATSGTSSSDAAEKKAVKKEEKESGGVSKFAMSVLMVISTVLGVLLAVGLFIFLPAQLYSWLGKAVPGIKDNIYLRSVFEGVFRIVLFVGYMLAVSRMKDIRRTFMYHGAEHKTIFCYEHGKELTVENVRVEKRFHPRCGTSFMILMLLVGIIIGMFIHISSPIGRTAVKLLLLPVTVGIGYELIKLAGRKDNLLTRIISAPGMWLQHITTVEPDDGMIECAIKAFVEVLPEKEGEDNW